MKRILLLAMHSGYVRNYERTLKLLLEEGHDVHVAVVHGTKQSEDRVAERMANNYVNLSISQAPKSPRGNVENLRRALRGLGDYMRYQHPRFADATALRERAASKLLKRRSVWGFLPAVLITLYVPTLGRIRNGRYADLASAWLLRLANGLPAPPQPTEWLRSLSPDVFLTTPHVALASSDPEFLDAARALGIPSSLLVASWDNLTNKGLIKSPTDLVVVWNEAQRREAVELHGVPHDRVVVTGAQRFDEWFEMSASSARKTFTERIGLDPAKPFVLYLCSSPFIAPNEVPFVRRLAQAVRGSDSPIAEAGLLVRPHPQNAQQWMNIDFTEYGNAVIWPRAGEQPVRTTSKQAFYDSMYHSLAVIGINTSAQIEAGIVGRTVHTVLDPEFASAQEGTLHFRHLLVENGGLLYVARDLRELVRNVQSLLETGQRDEHTTQFVQRFVRPNGMAEPASPIVADAIRRLLDGPSRSAVEIVRVSRPERLLLALLAAFSFPADRKRLGAMTRQALGSVRPRLRAWRRLGRDVLRGRVRIGRRAARSTERLGEGAASVLVVEPWRDDLSGEMLYWIPIVRRYCRSLPRDTRVVVVTNDSDPRWYSTLKPEVVIDERELDRDLPSREALAVALGIYDTATKPSFYAPSDGAERIIARMRADALSGLALGRAAEFRSLFPHATAAFSLQVLDSTGLQPMLVRDVLNAAETREAIAVVFRPPTRDDAQTGPCALDVSDRIALTTALEGGLAVITTDLGVAALAVSMCVGTTLVRMGSEHAADLDVLERIAVALEVDIEILEPTAMRALLAGDLTEAPSASGPASR